MARRMSCSLTVDAVQARTKTVTRRSPDTWRTLKAGDHLTLVEKAMGLRKGERQRVLAEVEIVDVRVELLTALTPAEIAAEGFDPTIWHTASWCGWWALEHGHRPEEVAALEVRRIEWRYL